MRPLLLPLAALSLAAAAPAPAPLSPTEIVAAAPASAWRAIDPATLLVLDLAQGGRAVIALAPGFAPAHVANIVALVRAGWFDGNAIVRVQDNYVVQWGGAPAPGRMRPKSLVAHPPAEYERPRAGLALRALPGRDVYAAQTGFVGGFPVASDGRTAWLAHCYAMVGVGRDMPPDTGDGSELYAVIGQAPRHLDRNIALVGRVIDGMERLAALPRGGAALGFYASPAENSPILRARLASDMPPAERPHYEEMDVASPSFATYLAAKTNRRDAFFVRPANALDLCAAPVPTRPAGAGSPH
ncbi:peptidylprolyl isomerase [Sphingomonas morindae]|uniref:peptidylprolyl isomerase n=1 Tax=Sphingomonas morindae TaxID=1541170 RepID=A0ABY4X8R6_9SPHN|nr:peptidylprolyl isomerase [Sphingomonas morindae]USI73333.1 peptidylprolyl isomerase [Sphingomonas morindae]